MSDNKERLRGLFLNDVLQQDNKITEEKTISTSSFFVDDSTNPETPHNESLGIGSFFTVDDGSSDGNSGGGSTNGGDSSDTGGSSSTSEQE